MNTMMHPEGTAGTCQSPIFILSGIILEENLDFPPRDDLTSLLRRGMRRNKHSSCHVLFPLQQKSPFSLGSLNLHVLEESRVCGIQVKSPERTR